MGNDSPTEGNGRAVASNSRGSTQCRDHVERPSGEIKAKRAPLGGWIGEKTLYPITISASERASPALTGSPSRVKTCARLLSMRAMIWRVVHGLRYSSVTGQPKIGRASCREWAELPVLAGA